MLQNRLFLLWRRGSGFGAAISDAVARSSIVLCNSVSADRIVMAASRLLGHSGCMVSTIVLLQYKVELGSVLCKLCSRWEVACASFVVVVKFRSQTSDNMDRWKAEQGRGREKRKIRRKKSRRERVRRKKMQMREKVGKSRNTVFFQWFVAPEGRKVGSLKRRVRSQLARWEMKNCTPLWREAHFEVKMYKTHQGFGPLLEVEMSKKCTPLWREAHFQVKMYKTHQVRTTFGSWDVEKVHAVVARSTFRSQNVQNTPGVRTTFGSWDVEKVHAVVARSTFRSQNVQNTTCSDHFWRFRCRKSARRCGAKHISKSKCTKH